MSTAATIQASIDSIDEEIGKLNEARETLVGLLDEAAEGNGAEAKPAKRSRRAKVTEEEDKPARRSRSRDKRGDERKASARSSNGKGKSDDDEKGPSKKEQIEGMLEEGMSPREIADEMGIATNYVYNVKRAMA